jgi:dihydrolipoyl dehydrogenase
VSQRLEVRVPDLGDFSEVEIIEVLVAIGEAVAAEQGLVTLETDKAAMDVPAPIDGTVIELTVSVGDRVSTGDLVAVMETAQERPEPLAASPAQDGGSSADRREARGPRPEASSDSPEPRAASPAQDGGSSADRREARGPRPEASSYSGAVDAQTELLVLGAGPGGYTAAFRAADLGLKVTLVERGPTLGGVCLNVGCIPSKALLHAAQVVNDAAAMADHGIRFGEPEIDINRLRGWKDSVVSKLTGGLAGLAKQRDVAVVHGDGRFLSPNHMQVDTADGSQIIGFEQCIIAAGSEPARIPGLPDDPRVMDSTGALALEDVPDRLLIIGGGIIGLEMACVYAALGSRVSVVELTPSLVPGADRDLIKPLQKRLSQRCEAVMLGTGVDTVTETPDGILVSMSGKAAPEEPQLYNRVLVAVGRRPNGKRIAAEAAGLRVDERGFIPVDRQMRTAQSHIFAIGDVVGDPMLAHKATHEGKVAAEVAAGHKRAFDARVIPSVAYTDPEVAWVGLTETQAKADGTAYEKGSFPWAASGRALSLGDTGGLTKLLFDPDTQRVIGGGIVGPNAGELIAEVALAIEMGADAADIGLTIHAHPTLSETINFSAEAFEGTLTDLYLPQRKR